MRLRRRSMLAAVLPTFAIIRQYSVEVPVRPPQTIATVHGNRSPLDWQVGLFDDFTAFVPSRFAETAATEATQLWETTVSPGTHHIGGTLEQEYYCNPYHTPGIDPFQQHDSILSIVASVPTPQQARQIGRLPDYQANGNHAPFISGALNSSRIFPKGLYCGYFELNCKLPRGSGMWTAFWLNYRPPPWSPEIDIMEQIGSKPTITTGTLHFDPLKRTHVPEVHQDVGTDLTAAYHTYGGLWTPLYVAWYFDGRLLGFSARGRRAGVGFYNRDNPMDIRINFALGTGMDDPPVTPAELPARFDIDWLRYSVCPVTIL